MITSQNMNNSADYTTLFKDAFDTLKEEGLLTAEEEALGRFTRLEEYFTRMGDLAGLHSDVVATAASNIYEIANNVEYNRYSKFLMLPLDEIPFEVNANTREITVPPNFKKYGVSVSGDQIAETLLFRIDRFIDYHDLVNTTIFVQWTRPGKEPEEEREGASLITLVDYETEPGKLWLGWPLTSEVTKEAGPLKFSLRFFKTNQGSASIYYSFNTLPAQVTIQKALYSEINKNIRIDEASTLFTNAITNSPSSGGTPALPPMFLLDLDEQAWLSYKTTYDERTGLQAVTDGLRLGVTVCTGDTGVLTYEWRKSDIVGFDDDDRPITANTVQLHDNISDVYHKTSDTTRNVKKAYYVLDATGAYVLTSSEFSVIENEGVRVTVTEDNAEVYERYSVLEIPPQSGTTKVPVVGLYSVTAQNRAGTSTARKIGTLCEIPSPKTLEFAENGNLNQKEFIDAQTGAKQLSISVIPDDAIHGNITYVWEKTSDLNTIDFTEVKDSDGNPISTGSTLTLAAVEGNKEAHIGWYKVTANYVLNRELLPLTSATCKLTDAPQKPTITSPVNNTTVYPDTDGVHTLTVSVQDMNGPLYSDKIHYEWYRIIADGEKEKLTADNESVTVISMENNILKVKLKEADEVEYFSCKVKNELNGVCSDEVESGTFVAAIHAGI